MNDRLGPWGEVAARHAAAVGYAEATLVEPLRARLAAKTHMIALTIVIAVGAAILAFAAGDYGLAACGAAAGHAAFMLYHDRFEPRGIQLGLKIAASFDGRSDVVEGLWRAIGKRVQKLTMLRVATLIVMAALFVWLAIG